MLDTPPCPLHAGIYPPWTEGMTHTFLQLLLRAVKSIAGFQIEIYYDDGNIDLFNISYPSQTNITYLIWHHLTFSEVNRKCQFR